jgi:hypothetical protein
MAEYIEREALLKDIEESVVFTVKKGQSSLEIRGANKITDRIKSAPTVDVVKVKHGYWKDNNNGTFTCSVCGGKASKMNWCGHCGAKMDGDKNE